jgi:hypothetical protein
MAETLVKNRSGRVILHLLCAVRDHRWSWHWQGITRELLWANSLATLLTRCLQAGWTVSGRVLPLPGITPLSMATDGCKDPVPSPFWPGEASR